MFFWYRWKAKALLPLTERARFKNKSRFRVEFLIFRALALVVFAVSESRPRKKNILFLLEYPLLLLTLCDN
jgi:hypothetical protein